MTTSKGEQKIINILQRNGITFRREVSFKGLNGEHGKPLRFDFLVRDPKTMATFLLEFDGKQHFEFTPYFHKKKADFHRQQAWDIKKNRFCLEHNIPLIRIPYWALDTLTWRDIISNPSYRVSCKNHNLNMGVRK